MKRKFSHEEIVVTSVLVVCTSSFIYCLALFIYNIIVNGVHMNI